MGKKMNLETKSFAAAISFALCCSSLSATAASSASSKNGELSAVLPAPVSYTHLTLPTSDLV